MATLFHCQICGREIKAKAGLIAHHGYQRPGDGWQTSSCLGARYTPYEQSRDRLPYAIGIAQQIAGNNKRHWAALREFPPEVLTEDPLRSWAERKPREYTKPADFNTDKVRDNSSYNSSTYEGQFIRKSWGFRNTIKDMIQWRYELQNRYDNWKPATIAA